MEVGEEGDGERLHGLLMFLTSTETIRLIRDGEKRGGGMEVGEEGDGERLHGLLMLLSAGPSPGQGTLLAVGCLGAWLLPIDLGWRLPACHGHPSWRTDVADDGVDIRRHCCLCAALRVSWPRHATKPAQLAPRRWVIKREMKNRRYLTLTTLHINRPP